MNTFKKQMIVGLSTIGIGIGLIFFGGNNLIETQKEASSVSQKVRTMQSYLANANQELEQVKQKTSTIKIENRNYEIKLKSEISFKTKQTKEELKKLQDRKEKIEGKITKIKNIIKKDVEKTKLEMSKMKNDIKNKTTKLSELKSNIKNTTVKNDKIKQELEENKELMIKISNVDKTIETQKETLSKLKTDIKTEENNKKIVLKEKKEILDNKKEIDNKLSKLQTKYKEFDKKYNLVKKNNIRFNGKKMDTYVKNSFLGKISRNKNGEKYLKGNFSFNFPEKTNRLSISMQTNEENIGHIIIHTKKHGDTNFKLDHGAVRMITEYKNGKYIKTRTISKNRGDGIVNTNIQIDKNGNLSLSDQSLSFTSYLLSENTESETIEITSISFSGNIFGFNIQAEQEGEKTIQGNKKEIDNKLSKLQTEYKEFDKKYNLVKKNNIRFNGKKMDTYVKNSFLGKISRNKNSKNYSKGIFSFNFPKKTNRLSISMQTNEENIGHIIIHTKKHGDTYFKLHHGAVRMITEYKNGKYIKTRTISKNRGDGIVNTNIQIDKNGNLSLSDQSLSFTSSLLSENTESETIEITSISFSGNIFRFNIQAEQGK
jgi:hypothetical protein